MASIAAQVLPSSQSSHPPKMSFVKTLSESPALTSLPSAYTFPTNSLDQAVSSDHHDHSIPIIDFSLLTSGTPDQRSKIVQDLGRACQDWGFFMVINHNMTEGLMKDLVDAAKGFFDLTEEEKEEFKGNSVLDPIRCGTSFNVSKENVFFWRDFLKIFIHPDFYAPTKPHGFRDILFEYRKKTRELARELLKGISESLGLEEDYIYNAMNMESSMQVLTINLYPPCPQPENAMGMPPHSDHGMLTLLYQNGVGGLQVLHNEKWVNVNAIPNSILVNTADHMEILTNGKYKSVLHRAVVNNKATRMSMVMSIGPAQDALVGPAPELVARENQQPEFIRMKYKEYFKNQQSGKLDGKSCLERLRKPDVCNNIN